MHKGTKSSPHRFLLPLKPKGNFFTDFCGKRLRSHTHLPFVTVPQHFGDEGNKNCCFWTGWPRAFCLLHKLGSCSIFKTLDGSGPNAVSAFSTRKQFSVSQELWPWNEIGVCICEFTFVCSHIHIHSYPLSSLNYHSRASVLFLDSLSEVTSYSSIGFFKESKYSVLLYF